MVGGFPQKVASLLPVTAATKSLQVGVLERGAPARELHDVVDFEFAGPKTAVARLASVAVTAFHVDPGRVPKVVTVELPLAGLGTVR